MTGSIFSTYKQGENRVTGSILAVLRSLSLSRIERIVGALTEQPEFELVRFQNQPAAAHRGVPDAEIVASCRILVETKIKRNAVSKGQLERHLERLVAHSEAQHVLIVLTPDEEAPEAVGELGDARVVWASFAKLDEVVDAVLRDEEEVVSEREAFLLKELQKMLLDEGLILPPTDTVVVPARRAWDEYRRFHSYVCQERRAFQPIKRLAFYRQNRIEAVVPAVLEVHDRVLLEESACTGRLADVIAAYLTEYSQYRGQSRKVFLLSAPDDPRTLHLPQPIPNDLRSANGRITAFTQNQRYVDSKVLRTARSTSELLAGC